MKPSLTLGCGSWGGNSVSENVGVKHLINVKTVAERRENMLWFRAPEKVYFKKGSTPVALDELGTIMGKKRAFIVTDQFLFKNGNTRSIEAKLDQMGIAHDCFYDVEPDPSLQCARRGAAQMALFEPDVIIAVGGGSAMDAGKIMWMMYEHPGVQLRGHGHGLHGHPQAHLHLPRDGQEGLLRRRPLPPAPVPRSRRSPSSPIRTPASSGRSLTTHCSPTWPSSTSTTP